MCLLKDYLLQSESDLLVSKLKRSLTQVFHTLREQSLKRTQAVTLRIHTLGQSVPEMHLVLEKQPAGWAARSRHGLHILLLICLTAVATTGIAMIRLLHVGVAVRRARRGRVALVVEDDIVRGWRHVTCAPITFRI